MKQKNYRRDTAFLYPELEDCPLEEKIHTLELITQITAIVTAANNLLMELVDGGTFSFVNCIPSVHMECISNVPTNSADYENIRICVAHFDEYDYTENYQGLIQEYKSGRTGISHLVALNITSRQQKALFSADKEKNFDTIITTSLDHLEHVLVSIMFDISIYHYFGLSNELPYRKKFNNIKFDYLVQKLDKKQQGENYGEIFPQEPIYLPISLPGIRKLGRRVKPESRKEAVKEMLNTFATFLAESSMSVQVKKDSQGDIISTSPLIPDDLYSEVEEIIQERSNIKKFSIVFLNNSTKNLTAKVVEYTDQGNLPCWVEKTFEDDIFYKIITVEQGGDRT